MVETWQIYFPSYIYIIPDLTGFFSDQISILYRSLLEYQKVHFLQTSKSDVYILIKLFNMISTLSIVKGSGGRAKMAKFHEKGRFVSFFF